MSSKKQKHIEYPMSSKKQIHVEHPMSGKKYKVHETSYV